MRRWSLLVFGLLAALLLLQRFGPERDPTDLGRPSADPSPAVAERAGPAEAPEPGSDHAGREAAALASEVPAPAHEWTVRLAGIDPAVPWTAELQLVFQDQFEVRGAADRDGAFRFVPPAGARLPGITLVQLIAEDPHYRVAPSAHATAHLQETGQQEFTVFPIARLRGRVLGPDGAGIAARVRAFVFDATGPRAPLVASTDSAADGSYRLRVPPTTPVFVLAEAVHDEVASVLPGASPPVVMQHLLVRSSDDLQPDHRQPRQDLLPAGQRAEGAPHTERALPDLRLANTVPITGRVTFADGRPWTAARVWATPASSSPAWHAHHHWSPGEGLVAGTEATTDARGQFVLRLAPGVPFRVAASTPGSLLPAAAASVVATAPDAVEIVVPGGPLTLRALADGRPVPEASFDVGDLTVPADTTGERTLVLGPDAVRLRARTDTRASAWVQVPSGVRPPLVTFDLAPIELADVSIRLRGRAELTEAVFVWQPLPAGQLLQRAAERPRSDPAFRLRVPPGRYRLTVRGREGTPGGDYLLPQQLELDVPPSGFAGDYEVAFGGRLELDVLDANGVRVAGTFRLLDASGHDVTPEVMVWREGSEPHRGVAGELSPFHVNHVAPVLPPGDYTLTVHGAGRTARQLVTIQRSVTTRAAVQLR